MGTSLLLVIALLNMAVSADSVPTAAVHGFSVPAVTSAPYTYCIGYTNHPESPAFLRDLQASPPDLYHLGYQIPFKGALGPTYGHELFSDDILPPDQIPHEVERIKSIIRDMRATGVARLIPYVFTMAFFGNPDQRTGFFHFFDHWEDYRSFGLGPKPAADPALWSQVPGPRPLGGGPSDVLHYDPCVNHPAWQEYLDLVVRQLAEVGYDGMFFDVNTQYCLCPHCQAKFDVYLLDKYGREGLREAFGTDDHRVINLSTRYHDFEAGILEAFKTHLSGIWERENLAEILGIKNPGDVTLEEDWRLLRCYMQQTAGEFPPRDLPAYLAAQFGGDQAGRVPPEKKAAFVQTVLRARFHEFLQSPQLAELLQHRFGSSDIRRRCYAAPRDLLLWVETQRFWCDSMASLHGRLKGVGRAVFAQQGRNDDFYTVANLGSMVTVDGLNKRRVDGIDLVRWAPRADLQMFEEMPQPGALESGVILSNIFAFRWAMAAGTRAGTLLYKAVDDRAADLAEAEAAAGGGGAFIQPGLSAPESRRRWKQFFAEHADLWDGGSSWARVGLLFWNDQVFYEYPEHLAMTHRLVQVLAETQVPFDIVTEENLSGLREYSVIIAPMLRFLDNAQVDALLDYAQQGGNLIIIEPCGTEDKWVRPRPRNDAITPNEKVADFHVERHGKGRILYLQPDAVPQRSSDLWNLMEERAGAFNLARDFLNAARQADIHDGVDLGPRFIRRLEEALHLRLRWCPDDTPPSVYLHAYRIPPKSVIASEAKQSRQVEPVIASEAKQSRDQNRPERLVVHAVNYNVPIQIEKSESSESDPLWSPVTKAGEPVIVQRLRVDAPLPEGRKIRSVTAYSPTDPNAPVTWSAKHGRITLNLGELHIYKAIAIELEP